MFKQYSIRCLSLAAAALAVLGATPAQAVDLTLSNVPLFLEPNVAPLNMLVVGRDHKLYYEAYNDASDLDGDDKLDVGYKGYLPTRTAALPNNRGIDYYGYFDSYKCYTYASDLFTPVRHTANKRCAGEWSGDYLNYLTTSRIDALRKVLYGGKRDVDSDTQTVLIRSHIPMDAHSWGKEYSGTEDPNFDIHDFTPYTRPTTGTRHLFANTTPNVGDATWTTNNGQPRLRVLLNRTYRIWEWVSKESPVAGTIVSPAGSDDVSVTFDGEFSVRVAVCVAALIDDTQPTNETCLRYPDGNYKPVGLLHEFGENDSMLFGLLSGSYTANKSGGVLRKNIGSIRNEIDPTDGTLTNVVGIIKTLDSFRVAGYTRYTSNGGTNYDCGLPEMARGAPTDGACMMWGNPVAEMMYETLRYFRGLSPEPAFTRVYSGNDTVETALGLPTPAWVNPYLNRPVCAKPFETVMADINNSYDSDQLPGSRFTVETGSASLSAPLGGLDVGDLADQITRGEPPGIVGLHFIGQSGVLYDGSPKPKDVTSLANIRGLAPEEPTKQGSYYPASVAYHGLLTDANPVTDQKVQTFAVALASPLPQIKIPVGPAGSNRFVTLVPFAKSVDYGTEIDRTQGAFQPTNQIVDFYVENIAEDQTSGTFQVNFEDVEAGNDHDMDAIARYSYRLVNSNTVEVNVSSDYEAGGIIHHIGYVISGTTQDGVYLVVQDCNQTSPGVFDCNGTDPDYFLDTPNNNQPLPATSSRQFTAASGTAVAATLLKDPLWYAAKWGGFEDGDGSNTPNVDDEWDGNGDGDPDNYFLVTNALTLSQQLRATFREILDRSSSASAASVNSGSISTDTRIYQAIFDTESWTGTLTASAFVRNPAGNLVIDDVWEASDNMPGAAARNIITVNSNGNSAPFTWAAGGIDATRRTQLDPDPTTAQRYLNYLRGDASGEQRLGGNLRNRIKDGVANVLGDIVSSAPIYVGPPRARYSDTLEPEPYSAFAVAQRDRDGVVYAGGNDGMLHAFHADRVVDADGTGPGLPDRVDGPTEGREIFAFIPETVFGNLRDLTQPSYSHRFYVDGSPNTNDVYTNNDWRTVLVGGLNFGGQGIYALDVTNPGSLGTGSFLWEINDRTLDANGNRPFIDLGFTYSQPAIVRLQDGTWAAVFGNGYNNTAADTARSTTGNAVLYIVDIETGELLRKFDTGVGMADDPTGASRPNGMATPTMVDVDGDRVVDHAYVGDLFGNLWKIDLRATTPADWHFAFGTDADPLPFFVATDAATPTANRQPITSRVEVARGPFGAGVMVLFGTGKYLENTDKVIEPRRDQSFYGLFDANTYLATDRITGRSALTRQTITSEYDLTGGFRGRTTSSNSAMGPGWYLDLVSPPSAADADGYQGERVVTSPLVRDDRVIFTTLIPSNDECGYGGKSWLMVLDLLSGSKLTDAQLDTDGDGDVDAADNQNTSGISNNADDAGIWSQAAGLRCLSDDCPADRLLSSSTNGTLDERALRSIAGARGRQSWRQIR